MKQKEEIRHAITEVLKREEQMPKKDLIEAVYARLTVTQVEVKAVWSVIKKEDIVYCVNDLPGWVGIY
ncbi:MAG: hypothetical protein LBS02_06975 [Hungatella sp.]|jgi:hypothetical protein|nr:hypothetical protein [Hungatella sp.]